MASNRAEPKIFSAMRPMFQKHHILKAMCTIPTCTKAQLTSRQGWLPSVSGPQLAPQRSSWAMVGSEGETPVATMAANTPMLSASRRLVNGKRLKEAAGERDEPGGADACWHWGHEPPSGSSYPHCAHRRISLHYFMRIR